MMDSVKDGKRTSLGPYGCFEREPYLDSVACQDGWTEDGRRIVKIYEFRNTYTCPFGRHTKTDKRCYEDEKACRWMDEK